MIKDYERIRNIDTRPDNKMVQKEKNIVDAIWTIEAYLEKTSEILSHIEEMVHDLQREYEYGVEKKPQKDLGQDMKYFRKAERVL